VRCQHNPLEHARGLNTAVEGHRERRTLAADEFARFLDAAEASTSTIRKLTGPERAMLYRVASRTGFRAQELASLTPESFDLAGDDPVVTVAAAYSKRKREDVQRIPADLVESLRRFVADRPKGKPVWRGKWWIHAAKMVRADLAAAQVKWVGEAANLKECRARSESSFLKFADNTGRVFDFHALRGKYVT